MDRVTTMSLTPHGVTVGPITFEVMFTDETGRVCVRVGNERGHLDVYSSPKGHSLTYFPSAQAKRGA